MFQTYVVYNSKRRKIYIGQTSDLEKRLQRHNGILKNKSKSFTSKNSGIWRLIYAEQLKTRQEAIKREKQLKSFQGRKSIKNLLTRVCSSVAEQ